MWLSERAAAGGGAERVRAGIGTVTIGGKNAAVLLKSEQRNIGVVGPQGLQWRPGRDSQVLVLETEDGERYILGAAEAGSETLGEGELCLKCGETWLKIGHDGSISAEGEVHICGDVYVTGRLFLNGIEVQAGGTDD